MPRHSMAALDLEKNNLCPRYKRLLLLLSQGEQVEVRSCSLPELSCLIPFLRLPPQITNTEANKNLVFYTLWSSKDAFTAASDPSTQHKSPGLALCPSQCSFLRGLCLPQTRSDHSRPSPPSPPASHNSFRASGFIKTSCNVLAGSFQTKPIADM